MNKFGKSVFSSVKAHVQLIYAAVLPLLRRQCLCKPNAERRELALKSYAEVQPDFAVGNVSANRMQNLKTRFRKFC